MKNKGRYIQFPLSLLRSFFIDKKNTINRILNFGIYYYSKKINFNIYNVAQQIVYDNYRGNLTSEIKNIINSYDFKYFGLDEDYNGFDTKDGFNPTDEINEILHLFNKDEYFKNLSIEYYRIHLALQSLKIEASNIDSLLLCAKNTESKISDKEPLPMVNIQLLFDFMAIDNEFDIMQFLCYISLKSILCKKSYSKTNKNHVLFRMFGYKSSKEVDIEFNTTSKELFSKYEKRYHFDKLMNAMQLNWKILYYSYQNRGFYVGNSNLITLEEIIKFSIIKKQSNKLEELKKLKNNTRNNIIKNMQQIN